MMPIEFFVLPRSTAAAVSASNGRQVERMQQDDCNATHLWLFAFGRTGIRFEVMPDRA